ncbi:MAG: CvpA family protein [Gammaproteobacteria bacterium]
MDIVDIAIIAIVLLSAVIGIFRGFVREVLSLISWVAAFFIAFRFHGNFASYLTSIEPESLRNGVAFLGVFFVVLIAFSLFNYVISRLMNSAGLSGADRLLGVLFGIARGAVIVMILIDLAGLTPFVNNRMYKQSTLIPHFQSATEWVKRYLPEDIKASLNISEPTTTESDVSNSDSVPIEINKIIKGE